MGTTNKITNTTNNVRQEWLMGGNPCAIEAQELQGQWELIESQQLPKECNSPSGINAIEQYSNMGIKVLTASKDDDLFLDVNLPNGWKKKATDHSMWSDLIDNKGRIRAAIFYKAAFYDRKSFINFCTRYNCGNKYYDEKIEGMNVVTAIVKDNATGEILFESEKHTWCNSEQYVAQAKGFLKENYPYFDDINAYWD